MFKHIVLITSKLYDDCKLFTNNYNYVTVPSYQQNYVGDLIIYALYNYFNYRLLPEKITTTINLMLLSSREIHYFNQSFYTHKKTLSVINRIFCSWNNEVSWLYILCTWNISENQFLSYVKIVSVYFLCACNPKSNFAILTIITVFCDVNKETSQK